MANFRNIIEQIIENNTTDIPYEGKDVDVANASDELNSRIIGLMRGFGTFVLKNFLITSNGWLNTKDNKYYSKDEAIELFIEHMKTYFK